MGGQEALQKEVLLRGLCTACGACVNICPYMRFVSDRVIMLDKCGLAQGRCYEFCPRTELNVAEMDSKVFGTQRKDALLGRYMSIITARPKDKDFAAAGQNGGAASALSEYIVRMHEADAMVLTRLDESFFPTPVTAKKHPEVLSCAGSKYTVSSVLAKVNELSNDKNSLGIVGTGCQIAGLRKMQISGKESGAVQVKIALGLFCTETFKYPEFYRYLTDRVSGKIKKIDIARGAVSVDFDGGRKEFPLKDFKHLARETCKVCCDVTAEWADLSFGSVGSEKGWTTVIVRSDKGNSLVQSAKKAGVIDVKEAPDITVIRDFALRKKKSALQELSKQNLTYLGMSEEDKKKIMEA